MNTDRAALLQAIIDDPDDDVPRQVYADWLEEHGDQSEVARARCIRLALEKARLPPTDSRRKDLLRRMGALLRVYRSRWFPDSPLVSRSRWKTRHRGFIRRVRCPATWFNKHAPELFSTEPVTSLYLEPGAAGFDEFADSPLLARLRRIDCPDGSFPPGGLARLAGRLASLRKLELSYWKASHAELEVFARAPWPHLRYLGFLRCGLDDQALGLLARLNAPRLNSIQLFTERFSAEGTMHLLGAPWLSRLTQLDLVQVGGALTPEAIRALAQAPQLANLRSLNLSYNHLGPEGLAVLARSPHLGRLRRLDLGDNDGGALGLLALFTNPTLRRVRELSYPGNNPDFTAVEAGEVTPLPSLRRLCINSLGDHGLAWLLEHSLLDTVRHLLLYLAGLSGAGFLRLLRSSLPKSLVTLSLSHNRFDSLDGLPSSLDFPRLQDLEMSKCHLGDQGAVGLLRALRAPRLRKLSLSRNGLGNESVQALTSNPTFRNLEELSMSYHSGIDDEGARLFCESPYLDRLEQLQLLECGVSDDALARLRRRFRHVRR